MDALAKFIEESLQCSSLEISLDQLLSDLDTAGRDVGGADLQHTRTEIILSTELTELLVADGYFGITIPESCAQSKSG